MAMEPSRRFAPIVWPHPRARPEDPQYFKKPAPIDLEPEANAAKHAQAPAQTRDDDSDMSDGTLLKVCEHIEQQVALKKQRAADADAKWDEELWAIFDELEQTAADASKAGSPKAQVDRAAPVMVPVGRGMLPCGVARPGTHRCTDA